MFEEMAKKQMDKIFIKFNIETDPIYTPRFRKFIKFVGYKVVPAILQITTIIVLFWIMFKIYNRSGFEKVMIILNIIIILTLRSLVNKLS